MTVTENRRVIEWIISRYRLSSSAAGLPASESWSWAVLGSSHSGTDIQQAIRAKGWASPLL